MAKNRNGSVRHAQKPVDADGSAGAPFRMRAWALVVWVALWQLASVLADSALLVPSPLEVLVCFHDLAFTPDFWSRVGFTLVRIAEGFALGVAIGSACSACAMACRAAGELMAPAMALAKSVPVACFVVLALIWAGASELSVVVSVLVVAPIVYENLCDGLRSVDGRLLEMARLFRVPLFRKVRLIYIPHAMPFLRSACASSLGMAWKAGVAAEIIAIPAGSMGEALYGAKIYFDTTGLFAWTFAVVCLSVLFERVFVWILGRARGMLERTALARDDRHGGDSAAASEAGALPSVAMRARGRDAFEGIPPSSGCISYRDVSKSFSGVEAFSHVSFTAQSGKAVCLMAPSGFGKTTLLRMAAGLEHPDEGTVACEGFEGGCPLVSMSFQEDRLIEHADALENASIALRHASARKDDARALLEELGVGGCIGRPVRLCSGGQRRRIALARALLAPHGVLLLDEPFSGLDDASRERAACIVRRLEGRSAVIVATHDERDARLLDASVIGIDRLGNSADMAE